MSNLRRLWPMRTERRARCLGKMLLGWVLLLRRLDNWRKGIGHRLFRERTYFGLWERREEASRGKRGLSSSKPGGGWGPSVNFYRRWVLETQLPLSLLELLSRDRSRGASILLTKISWSREISLDRILIGCRRLSEDSLTRGQFNSPKRVLRRFTGPPASRSSPRLRRRQRGYGTSSRGERMLGEV